MRPLEALAAVVGIYTSMALLTARNLREATAESWRAAQARDDRRRGRPIDF
jgi:hypothetical protein